MNVGEIRTLTASFAEDPNLQKFTAAKYLESINFANQQFAMDSKALYKTQDYVMVIDDAKYDLPVDFMGERGVLLNGIELDPIRREQLNSLYKGTRWDEIEGTPTHYIIDPMEAKKEMILFPIPNSISDGTSLSLTYYPLAQTLTALTDVPLNTSLLLVQYHIALAQYAAWLLLGYITQTTEIQTKRANLSAEYKEKVDEAIMNFGDTKSAPMSFHPVNIRAR